MIFVTVGTHEQPFDRLVKYMDEWAECHKEEVIIQTGFSLYEPCNCKWQKLFSYNEMEEKIEQARIVITHGGPSSFIAPLQIGKIPIVVPRKKEFGEHVNDHQLDFSNAVAQRQKNIIVVNDVNKLSEIIDNYDLYVADMNNKSENNNSEFCRKFEKIVSEIIK